MPDWQPLKQLISAHQRFVLSSHVRPDADAIGSEMGLLGVLESLGNAAHPAVAELIDRSYNRGDPGLQLSAVFAMGLTADRRWLPVVMDELRNPDEEMRLEAIRAAGNLGFSEPVDLLIDLLYDEELEIQLATVAVM